MDNYDCPNEPIYEDEIKDVVLQALHAQAELAVELSRVWEEQRKNAQKNISVTGRTLAALKEQRTQYDRHLQMLYEEFALGNLAKAEYLLQKSGILKERDALESKISAAETTLKNAYINDDPHDRFIARFKPYAEIQELTPEILKDVDVLDMVLAFPDHRLEIVWNYQDEWEKILEELERN